MGDVHRAGRLFGARYGNQLLLLMQAEERGIAPQFFLPYGIRKRRTGWFRHDRHVREGETGFKVWAAVKWRPTEDQVQEWEAAGRKVRRDPGGRPSIQVVGFRLESTFDPLSQDCCRWDQCPGPLRTAYAASGPLRRSQAGCVGAAVAAQSNAYPGD